LSTPRWSNEFSVLERSGYRSTSKEFLRNLRRLENHDVEVPRIGVLILGTLFSPRFKFNITEEVQFYNQRIQAITREHNVGREEIYYKHHPRLSQEQWQYKNERLDCNVVPFESETIAEKELLRPGVSAVIQWVRHHSSIRAHCLECQVSVGTYQCVVMFIPRNLRSTDTSPSDIKSQ